MSVTEQVDEKVYVKSPVGEWKPLPQLSSIILSTFKKGKRGKFVGCIVKANSTLAYELYEILYTHNVPPTYSEFSWEYSGTEVWELKILGETYRLIAEYLYINYCFDNPLISLGVVKGKKITLRKIK